MNINILEESLHRFLVSFFNVYGDNYRKFVEILLRGVEGDKAGLLGVDSIFVEHLINIINSLRRVGKDTLLNMKDFIERYRRDYRYLYVVDCLGLPEVYALLSIASRKGFVINLKVFVNVRGVTEPFKKTFGAETMLRVATSLHGLVIKRLDAILHSEEFTRPYNRDELINALVSRMKYVETLIHLEGATLVLSDHGYDITREKTFYFIQHGHVRNPIFAKLAPVLLFKK